MNGSKPGKSICSGSRENASWISTSRTPAYERKQHAKHQDDGMQEEINVPAMLQKRGAAITTARRNEVHTDEVKCGKPFQIALIRFILDRQPTFLECAHFDASYVISRPTTEVLTHEYVHVSCIMVSRSLG